MLYRLKQHIATLLLLIIIPIAVATLPIMIEKLWITLKQPATMIGIVSFSVLYFQYLKPLISVFRTLDHELSHAGIALLSGNKVTELNATASQGGHMRHYGSRHNFLISLAPYIWRIPMIAIVFVIWLLNRNQLEWYYLLVFGVVFGYRSISIFEEARPHQIDLKTVGLVRAYVWIICLNIIWLGIIATAMLNNYGLEDYLHDILIRLKIIFNAFIG